MRRVSSASNAPVNVDVPDANAAMSNARFVMLFDPGTDTTTSGMT